MERRIRFSVVALGSLFAVSFAQATQTDNHGMHAVPAPANVVIDGKLDDWDLSGQVLMCYDVESLKDVYSAQVAMMYDADNLYVGIHWTDHTPLGNSHDPHYQPERGWAGDCVQLRIKTDQISHITAWCYGAKMEPGLYIDHGKDLKTPFHGDHLQLFQTEGWKMQQGAEMGFSKDADGNGYTQELKLPWKLVTLNKHYKAGDQINCGYELLWGEADWPVHRYADNLADGFSSREFFFTNIPAWGPVDLEAKGHLQLPTPAYVKAMTPPESIGPVAIGYDLPEDARVTIAIDDGSGKRIRNLTPALPRTKGHNEEKWDGLDDTGKPVPPGEYSFRAIYHQTVHTIYTMSFANPGNPTWDTPDGKGAFYGDHSAPHAAATAGDFVALACPIGEAGRHLVGCNLDGQRQWGLANRSTLNSAGRITLATDGKLLYVGQDKGGNIYRVNCANGKFAPWNQTAKDANGQDFQILDLPLFDGAAQNDLNAAINLTALALHDGTLAACEARSNKIVLLDADTGKTKGEVAIDNPRAAAYDSDGTLVVVAGDHLVRISTEGKASPLGDAKLTDPFGLAVDASHNIYVSCRGGEQNVKVFDAAGKLTKEIGVRGGRPSNGPFADNAMLNPGGIAVDTRGHLWVTEEAQNPKRTSIWNTSDGTLVKDLVGTTAYSGAGSINAADPTMAFSDNTVYRIDLATGKWRPTYSLGKTDDPADVFPPMAYSQSLVQMHDGRTYVYTATHQMTRVMTFRNGRWFAAGAVGVISGPNDSHFKPYWIPQFAGHVGNVFAWSDVNGDGLLQSAEVTLFAPPTGKGKGPAAIGMYNGTLPDANGTITVLSPGGQALLHYPISRWTSDGVPVYDATKPTIAPTAFADLGKNAGFVMGGFDGRVYINQSPLVSIATDGKVLWTYPSDVVSVHGSHNATVARPGYLIGPILIGGVADMGGDIGQLFEMNGNLGEHYIFTADGLFVQSLFKDTRGLFEFPNQAVRGMSMDMTTSGGEDFGSNFVRTPDGSVYLVNGGTDARVMQLVGLDTIKRFGGTITYTPQQYAAAQQLAAENPGRTAAPHKYAVAKADQPPVMNGKLSDWPEFADNNGGMVVKDATGQYFGQVAMRYDAQNLYLAYRVRATSDHLRNGGQDPRLLFKTGDCVDLMLKSADAPKDAGGLRLLFSMLDRKPVAILYEKNVPGTAEKDRAPFSSPWRTIYFDRVHQLADVEPKAAAAPGGYLVEVAVPWKDLNLEPKPGLKLKGDVGLLFADSGGTLTVSRQYWSNKSTGLVNDVPGEADLVPAAWGEIDLK